MNSKDFVTVLKNAVVNDNMSIYKELFESTLIDDVTDDYWRQALTLFKTLTNDQQDVFFTIIRQTILDTTSNILGIIDGSCMIEGANDDFSLTYGQSNHSLAGDLQRLFLSDK